MKELIRRVAGPKDALAVLADTAAVVIPGHFDRPQCARWADGIYAARAAWTHDFGGEQFSLGRAFYTHYEEDRSDLYFADARASDLLVEAHAPGLQAAMRAVLAAITGGVVVPRRGWCGPGVHIFPPAGPVAERGGVVHFDVEGLTARHKEAGLPALTIVAMLQATPRGAEASGGLRVWDVLYHGREHASESELAAPSDVVEYESGDVVLLDSYRLHQIQPFTGDRERISATVHAARVDVGLWESWF